jgi:hypothetical protein
MELWYIVYAWHARGGVVMAGADQHQHSFLGGKGLGSNKERV